MRQRVAHGNLARAMRGSRKQQVGNVRAGDQQDERHRPHQRQEHHADWATVDPLVEREHLRQDVLVGVRICLDEPLPNGEELGSRLLERYFRGEAAVHIEPPGIALLRLESWNERERLPQIGVLWKPEAFGHHADHHRGDVVDADGSSENRTIATVAIRPDAVSEQHDRRGARPIVLRSEVAAEHGRLADHREGVCRHERAAEPLGCPPLVADVHRPAGVGGQRSKCLRRTLPVFEVEVRDADAAVTGEIA